ncbi:MAG TPA: 1,4-alpha-glucan branching protein domain-containing protein [Candidatus Limnocylindria bacterium]|nr:1,4-alpha-glucan branching protein domain-containing protein [Candidatus Limnocylindria bacterium]
MTGQLALILHAHLPFVRHPEQPRFFEESWLFEAITECYLPLLRMMDGWTRDGLSWRLTLTLTPTLCAMLGDPLLRARYGQYLDSLLELAAKELERTHLDSALQGLARFYHARLEETRNGAQGAGSVTDRFAAHQRNGNLEILTCAATHALLPLLTSEPASLRAQLGVAVTDYQRRFGRPPSGIWLPECAWSADLGPFLRGAGLRWFVTEAHALLKAKPQPRAATFAPVITPDGLAAFARDPASARQVWSRREGYPGDARYREFHRDLAHEAEWGYVQPHLAADQRTFTGFKYHRVTGAEVPAEAKELYDRAAALAAAREHAAHFVRERVLQCAAATPLLGRPPLLTAPYDAELFGHWWFEGPEFLDAVVRQIGAGSAGLTLTTPGEYLGQFPTHQQAIPATSSWGEGGHLGVWLDESNAWMQRPLRVAAARMTRLADSFAGTPPDEVSARVLGQAGRELLLAQASDWPFLVKMGTAGDYPVRRFRQHIENFNQLADWLEGPKTEPSLAGLEPLELRNNLFPELDWRWWCSGRTARALSK